MSARGALCSSIAAGDGGASVSASDRRQEGKKHFRVREDVFAVWSDGRRYPGSIQAVLPNGEVNHSLVTTEACHGCLAVIKWLVLLLSPQTRLSENNFKMFSEQLWRRVLMDPTGYMTPSRF